MDQLLGSRFRDATHSQAARDFMLFLRSSKAQRIYQKFGFLPIEQANQVTQP